MRTGSVTLDGLRQDLTFAIRSLRNRPGFALTTVLTLTVALAAAVSMFSVFRGVLLRPLPVEDQDRLVVLTRQEPRTGAPGALLYGDLTALNREGRSFLRAAGVMNEGPWPYVAWIGGGDRAAEIRATVVTAEFFQVLGTTPAAGRLLQISDGTPGAEPTAVISHALWLRELNGDPGVVGRALALVGGFGSYTIVGVAQRDFDFPGRAEVWTAHRSPADPTPAEETIPFTFIARLKPGATQEQAQTEFAAFQQQREAAYPPEWPRGYVARTTPLRDAVVGNLRLSITILTGAVALVLIIAHVNLASLLLIHGGHRRRELAVRSALGASPGRVAAPLLAEAGVIGGVSGMLGILTSYAVVRVVRAFAPIEIPRVGELRVDFGVLVFALASVAASTLFLSSVVVLVLRTKLLDALRGGVRAGAASRTSHRGKRVLVAAQVALAVVVLSGAGLLIQSLVRLQHARLGFDARGLTFVQVPHSTRRFEEVPLRLAAFDELVSRLEQQPGVVAVTPVTTEPFTGDDGWRTQFSVEGDTDEEASRGGMVDLEAVNPSYLSALRIPLLRGRGFDLADRADAPAVVLLSRSLAERHWPGQDPIGKRIKLGLPADTASPWRTVVGVVGDTRFRELTRPRPIVYVPFRQYSPTWFILPGQIAVRSELPAGQLLDVVRRVAGEVTPDAPILETTSFESIIGGPLARPRFNTLLLFGFASIALVLSTVGLYTLVASLVQQRTHEIGVRMALGAQRRDIGRLVVGHGLTLAAAGIGAGMLGTLASTRLLRGLLYEVAPADAWTLAGVALLLLATAALACYVPMRRATRVNPVEVLRAE